MPRSVVDLAKLNELDATIRSFDSNTGASMAAYYHSAWNLLSQFEAKLNELDMICQEAMAALNSCRSRQTLDDNISCASEEAAFDRAYRRYSRCAELVNQARHAVSIYNSNADQFRQTKHDLCSRAANGINRVMVIVDEYITD